MMTSKTFLQQATLYCAWILIFGCSSKTANSNLGLIRIEISNPLNQDRSELISVDLTKIALKTRLTIPEGTSVIKGQNIEAIDTDNDQVIDQLLIQTNLEAKQQLTLVLSKDWNLNQDELVKKTQAELSIKTGGEWQDRKYIGGDFVNVEQLIVPESHTDHSNFIRYEGPGLESDLIAYRFYLDWRNAMDVFGKKVDSLVLQEVGQDGFQSYHEPEAWGMDVLKAGKSLGIGSFGQLIDGKVEHLKLMDSVVCTVESNRTLKSSIKTQYFGWHPGDTSSNFSSLYSISAGSREIKHEVQFETPIANFCTGIVKNDKGVKIESLVDSNGWAYLATFGTQSLAEDNLGLAILYNTKDVDYITDADFDHLIVFKPSQKVKYYLLATWQQEKYAIQTVEEFEKYLNQRLKELNEPVGVAIQ